MSLPPRLVLQRRLLGPLGLLFGPALAAGLMWVTGSEPSQAPAPEVTAVSAVASAPKPPSEPRPQRAQRPRPSRAPAPPTPSLAATLSGPALPGFDLNLDLGRGAEALLDATQSLVMTEAAVDAPPQPVERPPAEYPARARAKGITGYVVLNLRVGADGRVEDVQVTESSPSGVFEESALSNVRAWRFHPATYEGRPVAVRVVQTLRFELS